MRCVIAILPIMFCVACGESYKDNQHAFDGVKFSASLKAEKNAPEAFSLRVKKAAKSVVGAREAGRYEATKYCVEKFGTEQLQHVTKKMINCRLKNFIDLVKTELNSI